MHGASKDVCAPKVCSTERARDRKPECQRSYGLGYDAELGQDSHVRIYKLRTLHFVSVMVPAALEMYVCVCK